MRSQSCEPSTINLLLMSSVKIDLNGHQFLIALPKCAQSTGEVPLRILVEIGRRSHIKPLEDLSDSYGTGTNCERPSTTSSFTPKDASPLRLSSRREKSCKKPRDRLDARGITESTTSIMLAPIFIAA